MVMGISDKVVVLDFGARSPRARRRGGRNPEVIAAYLGETA